MVVPIKINKTLSAAIVIAAVCAVLYCLNSCSKDDLSDYTRTTEFKTNLSEYNIFSGQPNGLVPQSGFQEYSLATQLFTDYAEKQRLISVPAGTKLNKIDNDLPDFPEGTMIVKTFYYFNDKRDPTLGKRIIETRLLIKTSGIWNAATYLWNDQQTDARLLESGTDKPVNWIMETGEKRVISYHVPNSRECATCHNSNGSITPIGPKIRNLNFIVNNNGSGINQLQHLQDVGILNDFDHTQMEALPQAFDSNFTLAERGRAYMEINCAHCHNPAGDAKKTDLFMQYTTPLTNTGILDNKNKIIKKTHNGEMPLLGTTIIDEKGVQLIKDYINSLD
jgi:uncharacterized repeat protein (TIGR03806 family)